MRRKLGQLGLPHGICVLNFFLDVSRDVAQSRKVHRPAQLLVILAQDLSQVRRLKSKKSVKVCSQVSISQVRIFHFNSTIVPDYPNSKNKGHSLIKRDDSHSQNGQKRVHPRISMNSTRQQTKRKVLADEKLTNFFIGMDILAIKAFGRAL